MTAAGTDGSGADLVDTIVVTLNETNVNDSATGSSLKVIRSTEYTGSLAAGETLGTVQRPARMAQTSVTASRRTTTCTRRMMLQTFYTVDANGNVSLTAAGAAAFTNDYELDSNSHQITVTAAEHGRFGS